MRSHASASPGGDGYTKPIPDILSIIKDSTPSCGPPNVVLPMSSSPT